MKINFLGDSITQGVGASASEKCFVALVGKKLGCTVVNCGLGGTRIARKKEFSSHLQDLDFNAREPFMAKNADFVFVFGGTNDYGHGDAPLGDRTSRDVYTFCGAVRTLAETLIKDYGKEKLCFILPAHRYMDGKPAPYVAGAALKDFVNAEKDILEEYGIPYINLFDEWINEVKTIYNEDFFTDGLHPNDKGHEYIADRVCEFITSRR